MSRKKNNAFPKESLEYAENVAASSLRKDYAAHFDYIIGVYNLLVHVQGFFKNKEVKFDVDTVALMLLSRLANDVRCIDVCSRLGYGVQACSIAASVFELAYAFADLEPCR